MAAGRAPQNLELPELDKKEKYSALIPTWFCFLLVLLDFLLLVSRIKTPDNVPSPPALRLPLNYSLLR